MQYFLLRNGQEYGPYSLPTLQQFLIEGSAYPTDLVRGDTLREWIPLSILLRQVPSAEQIRPLLPTVPPMSALLNATPALASIDNGNPVTWPFSQRSPFSSLWMILLWWVPFPIPLAQFLASGWSLNVIRRKSEGHTDLLPRPENMSEFLRDGAIVFVMYVLYYVIPVILIGWITAFSASDIVWPTIKWVWQYFTGVHSQQSLSGYLWGQFLALLLRAEWPVIYLAIASPLFMIARIRFARTQKTRSFFALFSNLKLLCKNPGDVLATMFQVSIAKYLLGILAILLAATGLGTIVSIALGAVQIWIVAYLLGKLAAKFVETQQL